VAAGIAAAAAGIAAAAAGIAAAAAGIVAAAAESVAAEGMVVGVVAAEGMAERIWPSQQKQHP